MLLKETPSDEILQGIDCVYIINYNYFNFKNYNQGSSDTSQQFQT